MGFTEIIRSHESWRNTDVLSYLDNFTGNLLLFIGDEDKVIPSGVINLIDKHSNKAKKKENIKLKGCPHAIHDWLMKNPSAGEIVERNLIAFSS